MFLSCMTFTAYFLLQFAALKNPRIAAGNEGSTWFYSTITDLTDGRGFYPCIPSGSYKINVSWTDTHIALVFEELSIDILNANLDVTKNHLLK